MMWLANTYGIDTIILYLDFFQLDQRRQQNPKNRKWEYIDLGCHASSASLLQSHAMSLAMG